MRAPIAPPYAEKSLAAIQPRASGLGHGSRGEIGFGLNSWHAGLRRTHHSVQKEAEGLIRFAALWTP